jgi:hypothetical protein
MSIPTVGETYSRLMEHLRKSQEEAAMMAHLVRDGDRELSRMWLRVSENFKKLQHSITNLAKGRLN